jgi:hypothetical protein
MDMSSTVHNCFLFQYNSPKYKSKLINKIYTKIHKTIYDTMGNQKDNFKGIFESLPGKYITEPSSGVFLDIKVKKF